MSFFWRDSADAFADVLRRHGVEPDAVADVEAAWQSFTEFLQTEVSGTDADGDADGFIVQWGRNQWTDGLPSLNFTRQFAVSTDGPDDPYPVYWQLNLEMCFSDHAEFAGMDELNTQDTDFSFSAVGPERLADLAEARAEVDQYRQLRAMWRTKPVSSKLTFEGVC
ncbi:hypothetical protein ACFQZ4_24600 [Catellatospora coxensis]|uniref:Uncharacterized protein n=1 Tax=Catellatospora coxensis TaxID=310354 RepID=A0A8J3KYQ2_9ACTN|nr:hypothetical protein [Catellatospora coxensis]GIG05496.1 hypothetical protein Cco03nite_21960 [Catellatospora coxensis]